MSTARTALIVGGGIGGLSAAIALRRRGIEVDLVEKSRANVVPGVGIILQGNALRALNALGVLDACLLAGGPFKGFTFFDAQGNNPRPLLGALTAGPQYPAMLGITRAAYSDILTRAAQEAGACLFYEKTVRHLTQDETGVEVAFCDGDARRYDVIVAADGIYSAIRQMVFGSAGAPRYTGQAAWRVNLPRPEGVDTLQLYASVGGRKAGLVPLRSDLMYLFLNDLSPDPTPPKGNLADMLRERLGSFGGLVRPVRTFRIRYRRGAGSQNRHLHGDPAYPPEEALLELLRDRASPGAGAPSRKVLPAPSVLALILSWMYAFHLPLYRQCQIFALERLEGIYRKTRRGNL